jgi:hypothetical protein
MKECETGHSKEKASMGGGWQMKKAKKVNTSLM